MAKLEIPSSEFTPELVRGAVKGAMKSADAKSVDLWQVPPSKLRVIPGFNVRIRTPAYLAHIKAVTQSIIENGYYQDKPLAGFVAKEGDEDVIYITDGHTRHESVNEAISLGHNVERVPVVVKPNGTSLEDLTFAMANSNDLGRHHTPYERALLVKRLVGMAVDVPTIAKRLTLSEKYVNDLLTLAGAPKVVRDLVVSEKVTATLAIVELTKHGAKAADRLKAAVEKAAASGKVRATAKHVEKSPKVKQVAPKKGKGSVGKPDAVKLEIDINDVLADAAKCGLSVDKTVTENQIIAKFAATLLDRFGISVFHLEPKTGVVEEAEPVDSPKPAETADDPAAGL